MKRKIILPMKGTTSIYRLGVYEVRKQDRGRTVEVWNIALNSVIQTFDSKKAARNYVDTTAVDRALVSALGAEAASQVLDAERRLTSCAPLGRPSHLRPPQPPGSAPRPETPEAGEVP